MFLESMNIHLSVDRNVYQPSLGYSLAQAIAQPRHLRETERDLQQIRKIQDWNFELSEKILSVFIKLRPYISQLTLFEAVLRFNTELLISPLSFSFAPILSPKTKSNVSRRISSLKVLDSKCRFLQIFLGLPGPSQDGLSKIERTLTTIRGIKLIFNTIYRQGNLGSDIFLRKVID